MSGDNLQVVLFFVALGAGLLVPALKITDWTRRALIAGAVLSFALAVLAPTAAGWWPWLARTASTVAASPVSWFVVVMFVALVAVLRAPVRIPLAPSGDLTIRNGTISADGFYPFEPADDPTDPPEPVEPGSHYDTKDRQLVRDALRELNDIIWKQVSPAQIQIHQLGNFAMGERGKPQFKKAISGLQAALEQLDKARAEIRTRFVHGRDEGDEAWRIMGNTDPLSASVNAVISMINALRASDANTEESQLFELVVSRVAASNNANSDLGAWVQSCINGIRARREALGGD